MIFRATMMLSTAFSMSGCGGLVIYDGSRNQSRDVMTRAMAARNPELDSDEAGDCVVSGMSVQETVKLGISDVRKVTAKTKAQLEELLARAEVAACIAALPRTAPVQ